MTYLPRLASQIFDQPLLIERNYLEVALSAIHDRLDIEPLVSSETLQEYHRPSRGVVIDRDRRLAIVPIVGSMQHRGSSISSLSGSTSYTAIQNTLREVASERDVHGIVLDMDTPGGAVAGIYELGEYIKALKEKIPIYAVANSMMASAGYWLGSNASRIYASPMSMVGSIGVVTSHIDRSKEIEKRGQVVTFITAGAHKVEGHEFAPLPEPVRASIQARINKIYDQFVSTVSLNRGLDEGAVRATEAGVFDPEEAKERGLVDGFGTLADAVDAMSQVTRPRLMGFSSSPSIGAMMSEKLVYSDADLARARDEGAASAAVKAAADADAAVKKNTQEIAAALLETFKGDPRVETFADALADGGTTVFASKMALRVAPGAGASTESKTNVSAQRFDELASKHAPNVEAGKDNADPRAARREQLKRAAAAASALPYSA